LFNKHKTPEKSVDTMIGTFVQNKIFDILDSQPFASWFPNQTIYLDVKEKPNIKVL